MEVGERFGFGFAAPGSWSSTPSPSLTVLVEPASWSIRAGLSIAPRVLSVTVPYNILCPCGENGPPLGVTQWDHPVSWSTNPRQYTQLRSSQSEGRVVLDSWWSPMFRVSSHDRSASCVLHSCSLCGVVPPGQGCRVCGTHVWDLCISPALPGWPHLLCMIPSVPREWAWVPFPP